MLVTLSRNRVLEKKTTVSMCDTPRVFHLSSNGLTKSRRNFSKYKSPFYIRKLGKKVLSRNAHTKLDDRKVPDRTPTSRLKFGPAILYVMIASEIQI